LKAKSLRPFEAGQLKPEIRGRKSEANKWKIRSLEDQKVRRGQRTEARGRRSEVWVEGRGTREDGRWTMDDGGRERWKVRRWEVNLRHLSIKELNGLNEISRLDDPNEQNESNYPNDLNEQKTSAT